MESLSSKGRLSKRQKVIASVVVLILVGIFAILELTRTINIFNSKSSTKVNNEGAKTTSKQVSAQSEFTDGNDKSPGERTEKPEATVQDNAGNVGTIPDSSQWTTSSSGAITAYSPNKNSVIRSDSVISGKSSTSVVHFRLIDSVSGVISQGQLSVINGKFSGTLSFNTSASEGRIDLFSTRADGGEENSVEIPVRFR